MNNLSKVEYKNIFAFHPGYYLNDMIEDMEITQAEFAKRLGISAKSISKLVNGQIELSDELAQKLSNMTGTSIDVWLNLQKTYTEKVLEIENQTALDSQIQICNLIDYSFFTELDVISKTRDPIERVRNLCSYLKIADLNILKCRDLLVNYRTGISEVQEKNIINANAWLQVAINIGKASETKRFDESKLNSCIGEIRAMTIQEPGTFMMRLNEIFNECGISFVLLPPLRNSGINGAVKWINNHKVILAMNNRRRYADTFWFSLFHEIKHILQKKITKTIIDGTFDFEKIDEDLEIEADLFAQNVLIPENEYKLFTSQTSHYKSVTDIQAFAKNIGIHPGIVVGRLQNDKLVHQSHFNGLREKYQIICQ